MIERLKLIVSNSFNPYRNLALEEYLLGRTRPGECILYLWQNENTVVIGRNQNAWGECRCGQLERDGGHLARRLSGGGAVYHDRGNLNFTFFAQKEEYDVGRQTEIILRSLKKLGIPANKTGRNDLVVDGHKVSGHAYYESEGACYHHGTLMVDVQKEKLAAYLNVNVDKLKSNGVKSVTARVANLTEYNPLITVAKVKQALSDTFQEEYGRQCEVFYAEDIKDGNLKRLEEKYESWEWNFGKKIHFENHIKKKFGWGLIEMDYTVQNGRFSQVTLYSDSLYPSVENLIRGKLCGVCCRAEEIEKIFSEMPADSQAEREIIKDVEKVILETLL